MKSPVKIRVARKLLLILPAPQRDQHAMATNPERAKRAKRRKQEMDALNPGRGFDARAADLRRSRARSRGLLGVVLIGVALWFGVIAAILALIHGLF